MDKAETKILRINGRLREVIAVLDEKGKVVHRFLNPVQLEFSFRDLIQVIVGATILAVPVAFTEETWVLGANLSMLSVMVLLLFSLLFISIFVYYNYYKHHGIKGYYDEFFKRVISTYVASFLVVSLLLVVIQKAPWMTDWAVALKRTIIVAFPASMSAAVADVMK